MSHGLIPTHTDPLPEIFSSVNGYIDADLVHSIHTTERRSFRGCRRRWSWIFQEGYYPLTTPKPLEFGVAYHKAMEVWYDPQMWGMDRDVSVALARKTFVDVCKKQLKDFLEKTNQTEPEPEVQADYDERVQLGLGMLSEYVKTSMQLDTNFRPVYVEKKFEVPITGPNGETIWCKCTRCWKRYCEYRQSNRVPESQRLVTPYTEDSYARRIWWRGLPVTYGGRIDMIAEDLEGRIWPYDWKTAMRLSTGEPNAPDDYLFLDDQVTSYCWALMTLGLDVAGFVYHEQKKAFPVEPEPLARARMGRLFSVNKQLDCDWKTYETTVRENDLIGYSQGLYDEFIQYLKDFGGVFHKRHQIHRTHQELVNAGHNIYLEALDITNPDLRIYPSAGRFGCTYCAFQDPCLSKNRDDDFQYALDTMFEKREKHYFQEPSTDKPDRG